MKKRYVFLILIFSFIFSFAAGAAGVFVGLNLPQDNALRQANLFGNTTSQTLMLNVVNEDSQITKVAEASSPSVVSIAISKEVPVYETDDDDLFSSPRRKQTGTEFQQVGSGTGFIITSDGMVVTNRHVVDTKDAKYTVIFSDGTERDAQVLGRDPIMDIAVIKIDPKDLDLKVLPLGDSDKLKVGQSVVAIGNSLGQFSNTVSSGIVSGLGRSIVAGSSTGGSERLEGVIQTDASINPGNSGGPLLDLAGNVIGVNVAVAQNAENVGFAIPIKFVLPIIDSVKKFGEIRRPLLGVRYQTVTPALAEEFDLPVDFGARIITGPDGEPAISKNSAAAEAGLKAEDIITVVNDTSLKNTSLQLEIQKYGADQEIKITYWRDGKEQTVMVKLKSITVDK
jgi:serine protease Do